MTKLNYIHDAHACCAHACCSYINCDWAEIIFLNLLSDALTSSLICKMHFSDESKSSFESKLNKHNVKFWTNK